jgi:hypothetical protein
VSTSTGFHNFSVVSDGCQFGGFARNADKNSFGPLQTPAKSVIRRRVSAHFREEPLFARAQALATAIAN